MFSLGDNDRYFLYCPPTDMRKSFHTLCGLVQNEMGLNPYGGDVFIFLNRQRTRMKLLHWEPGGLVLYSKMLEVGTFEKMPHIPNGSTSQVLEWTDLVMMVNGILSKKTGRLKRCESLGK